MGYRSSVRCPEGIDTSNVLACTSVNAKTVEDIHLWINWLP